MAHKKGVGSTDNGRDSNSKRLGVKLYGGQYAKAGNIIIRQRGTKFHPGDNVYMGKDYTLHAKVPGTVVFKKKRLNRIFVSISPDLNQVPETVAKITKAPAAKEAPKAEAAPKAKAAPKAQATSDDLTKIEGVGPKIAGLLADAGFNSFAAVAKANVKALKTVLENAGPRYAIHSPDTWPQQAQLAADGKWDELKTLQDELDGGKVVSASEEE